MVSRISGLISILGLSLLGSAAAWAGRGDLDPDFGDGGQLAPGRGRVFSLPDDRLLIDVTHTGDAFKVRVVDAGGRNDRTFGNGGYASVAMPRATPMFVADAAALGPKGEIYVEGTLWAEGQARFFEAVLRLDAKGQPDLSFGGQGDGFFRMSDDATEYTPDWMTTLAAFTVDAAGRIVVAQHGWTPENACGGPMVLRRFLANAKPDPAFGTAGTVELTDIDLCAGAPLFAAREDGSIVVGDGSTIVAIGTTGGVDPGFGANGRLHPSDSAWAAGFLLPDEGLLMFKSVRRFQDSRAVDAFLAKFDRNGQVDSAFGSGTGAVQMKLTVDYPGARGAFGVIDRLMLAPDATHLLAQTTVFRSDDGTRHCVAIARFSMDGMLDDQFGRHGLTCLDHGGFHFFLLSVQSEGAPVFQLDGQESVLRLLPDDMPSPGLVTVVKKTLIPSVPESTKTIALGFIRTAGRDGAVSIDYKTLQANIVPSSYYYDFGVRNASADVDYVTTSGRLDWADGEDGERAATVTIIDDGGSEAFEMFSLVASNFEGGALAIAVGTGLGIQDDDAVSKPELPSRELPSQESGGGSFSWATLLVLLTLLAISRRTRDRRRGE